MSRAALTIARRDFADAARSKLLWGVTAVLIVATLPAFNGLLGSQIIDDAADAAAFVPMSFQFYVTPLAIIVAYRSIVGERSSGSLRLLFGHPVTRRDFVLGKTFSRIALVVAVLLTATAALTVAIVATYGELPLLLLVVVAAYVAAYGAVMTTLTVGVSAAAETRLQSLTGMLGLFLVFGPFRLWHDLAIPAAALLFTGSTSPGISQLDPGTWPTWYLYVQRLNPMETFTMTHGFVAGLVNSTSGSVGDTTVQLFGLCVLLAWAVVPLMLGFRRFDRADLN
ncbi:ABC transporter permease subunit [Halomicrobium urmianum]|uniref:ABC transporter permease subunit n=1 Tax=Halomicrobium urmianum TaxID=1586233 RepID=UPI001CD9E19C|nr:ABC transporter permease subunit [Halomicrobium urmianum]